MPSQGVLLVIHHNLSLDLLLQKKWTDGQWDAQLQYIRNIVGLIYMEIKIERLIGLEVCLQNLVQISTS